MNTAMIFDIQRNSYVDGPGIRTTVFFKGCNLRCAWCHNPESQDCARQMLFYKDKCKGCGKCKDVCPTPDGCTLCGKCTLYCPAVAREVCGKEYTAAEVFAEIIKDKAYYDNSGGGVTFSGGECMLQINFLVELLKKCSENGIHTAVDTAGHFPFSHFEKILPYTDLVLYDIKLMDSEKHRRYTGVGNELILNNLARMLKAGIPVVVRVPVIPKVNDDEETVMGIADFFNLHGYPMKTEFLPYHTMGEHKYGALGRNAARFCVPNKEKMEDVQKIFDRYTGIRR